MRGIYIKALSCYLVLHVLAVLSCNKEEIDCGFEQGYFKTQGLDLVAYNERTNHTMPLEEMEESDSILAEELALAIIYQSELCWHEPTTPSFNNFFIHSALACSPPPPLPKDELTKFTISSDADLITENGEVFPAGTALNTLFDVSFLFGFQREPLVDRLNDSETFLAADASYILLLNVGLSDNQIHTFAVEVELNGQYTYSGATQRITILK